MTYEMFEREFRACVETYLRRDLPYEEGRAVLQQSEALTGSFAAVVGPAEAKRISARLLERIANVRVAEAV